MFGSEVMGAPQLALVLLLLHGCAQELPTLLGNTVADEQQGFLKLAWPAQQNYLC